MRLVLFNETFFKTNTTNSSIGKTIVLHVSGQVDGFSASPVKPDGSDHFPVSDTKPIVWGIVHVNIKGGYNKTTGKKQNGTRV